MHDYMIHPNILFLKEACLFKTWNIFSKHSWWFMHCNLSLKLFVIEPFSSFLAIVSTSNFFGFYFLKVDFNTVKIILWKSGHLDAKVVVFWKLQILFVKKWSIHRRLKRGFETSLLFTGFFVSLRYTIEYVIHKSIFIYISTFQVLLHSLTRNCFAWINLIF